MPTSNVDTATNANALTITEAGDYELTYNVVAEVDNAAPSYMGLFFTHSPIRSI